SNYFLRASAYFELGMADEGFQDLKNVQPETLDERQVWMVPLYSVLMGDYYSRRDMTSIARDFYQSVLKKSSYKNSPVYFLAMERDINNSIKAINAKATAQADPEMWQAAQFLGLAGDLRKYLEDNPFNSVARFLLGDLYLKLKSPDE